MIVKNGVIDISEAEFTHLQQIFGQDEIIQMISDAIRDHQIPLPYRAISFQDCQDAFADLKALDTKPLFVAAEWHTRYDYRYPLTPLVLRSVNTGNMASDYFHQENRWKCDSINAPSPLRTWQTEKFRLTLLKGLFSLKMKQVTMAELRSLIGLRKYIASQFRPSAAKAIIQRYNAKTVLDFSSGWGDRLAGFLASDAVEYYGIDPNHHLLDGYRQQYAAHVGFDDKWVSNIVGGAEDVTSYANVFPVDLVFTSPPYFNIERYTQDATQSFKKFKKLDQWLEGFLFKALTHSWEHLRVGGHMVINISDVYSNHTINKICDPMNDFINQLDGAKYVECIGYEMKKRPNSGAIKSKTGYFAEPMWVWRKT